MDTLRKAKVNARKIKHYNRIDKCLWCGLIRRLNMDKEQVNKLEDMLIQTSQTEKQREKRT